MNLLLVETWVLHYTYKQYPTSANLKNQEKILLRRGAAKNFILKLKMILLRKPLVLETWFLYHYFVQ